MCQLDWATDAQTFDLTLFWVCLWGCSWMRWTLEQVDWVERVALPSGVGLIQQAEGLKRSKRLNISQLRWNTSCLMAFKLGPHLHSYLQTRIEASAHSESWGCWTSNWNLHHWPPWAPTGWLQILGLESLYNHVSQFLIINLSIYLYLHLYLYLIDSISLELLVFSVALH